MVGGFLALLLALIGIALGLAAGAAGAQVLRSLLFGVRPLHPIAFAGSAVLFTTVSLVCYVPARRATCVDAMIALRAE
jgi:ABC-type antimicrobial peptide transport system permease subunit